MILTDIAQKIANDISSLAEKNEGRAPLNNEHIQTLVQAAMRKCDLVTREEFDAQSAVLARTRAKLEALEKSLAELEANHSPKD